MEKINIDFGDVEISIDVEKFLSARGYNRFHTMSDISNGLIINSLLCYNPEGFQVDAHSEVRDIISSKIPELLNIFDKDKIVP